ncbi:MAG: DnaA N-terminal domain-containing protein, partial [Pseudomonadota bacterium]|nr:DnaA N-terminal domain-containing protein [Pseudomonadota bacterium]
MTDDTWGTIQQDLLKTVGQNNFKTWIEPVNFSELKDGVATFHVPTNFIGNYVSQNYGDLILHQMNQNGADVQRMQFKVAAKTTAPRASKPAAAVKKASTAAAPAVAAASDTSDMGMTGAPLD